MTERGALPAWVEDLLRCPRCSSGLLRSDASWACRSCSAEFPVVDGVPILLDERTSVVQLTDYGARPEAARGALRRRLRAFIPGLGRSRPSRANYEHLAVLLAPPGGGGGRPRVLVVGGRVLGAGMEPLADGRFNLVETDLALGPRTAIVCDAQALPFADGSFDGVVIQAVLASVPDAARAVSEIHRVLAPAGLVYAEDSFMQAVYGGKHDFTRWTALGQRRLFREFAEVRSGIVDGPGTALSWCWQYFLLGFARSRVQRNLLLLVGRLSGFWLKYLDDLIGDRPPGFDAASGVFFLGRRADSVIGDREIVASYRGAVRSASDR